MPKLFPIVPCRSFLFQRADGLEIVLSGEDLGQILNYLAAQPADKKAPYKLIKEI